MRRPIIAVLTTSLIGVLAPSIPASAEECTITVQDSNTEVHGTEGPDVICVLGDNNTIYAGGGGDLIVDSGTGNRIYLEDGNDIYDGTGADSSFVDGGSGNDAITGTPGDDELSGGIGDDDLIGGEGIDSLNGGDGIDELQGGPGNDQLVGETGDDILDGGDGNDSLSGGDGNDSLVGGIGGDSLQGGPGSDTLAGNAGNDSLMGEVGSDNLSGGDGDDILVGGENLDVLDGGIGLNKCDYTDNETKVSSCIYDDAPPKLEGVTFTSPNWNSTESTVDITLTLRVTDDIGIRNGRIVCDRPATGDLPPHRLMELEIWGTSIVNLPLSSTLVSSSVQGPTTDRTYVIVLRAIRGTPPGSYNCFVHFLDSMLNGAATDFAPAFTVVRDEGVFDDDAPVVTLDSFSPQPLDSSNSDTKVTVRLHVEDATGVHSGQFQCSTNIKGNWFEVMNLGWGPDTPAVSRSATRVDLQFEFILRKDTMPGSYSCGGHQADVLGNHAVRGDVATFVVVNDALNRDNEPPAVVSGSISPTSVDVGSRDQEVTLSWRLTDATQLGWGYVACVSGTRKILDGVWGFGFVQDYAGRELHPVTTGTPQDMTVTLPLKIPFGTYPGKYTCGISASDILQQWGSAEFGVVVVDRTPPGMPTAPSNLVFEPNPARPSEGTLNWSAPADMGSPALYDYEVEVSRNGTTWTALSDPLSSTPSRSITNLVAGSNYWFRVRGDNGGNVVPGSPGATWSQPVMITTPDPLAPSAPKDIVLSNLAANSVSMSWSTPEYDGGSALTNYRITLSRDGGESWNVVPRATSTSRTTNVTGLAPGTEYLVRIAAINAAGAGEVATGTFTTLTSLPAAPTALAAKDISSTTLSLEWGLPESNGGIAITDYRVEFSSNNGSTWNVIAHDPTPALSFAVNGLTRGASYRFRVAAVNANGVGAWSTVVNVTTSADVPSAPASISSSSVTSNSAQVNWAAPINNGGSAITGYAVATSRDSGETWSELSLVGSSTRSLRISGMAPGSAYLVRVQAINGVGRSEPAQTGLTTNPGLAPPPGGLTAGDISTTALTLSWDLPLSNGGSPITDYRIEVSSNGTRFTAIRHTASNNRAFRVTGLRPGTAYSFRVSTVTSLGAGTASAIIRVVTVGNPPSPPTSLSVSSRRGVYTLSWRAATASGGSPVRNYVVEVSLDGGATWQEVSKPVSTSRTLRLNGLLRRTTYNVRVIAVNDIGPSSPSQILTFTTG